MSLEKSKALIRKNLYVRIRLIVYTGNNFELIYS